MVERKHISLIYQYSDNWIGGTYYILNIIKALKSLPDNERPFLTVYYVNYASKVDLNNINYPYIAYIGFSLNLGIFSRIFNRLSDKMLKKQLIKVKLPAKKVVNFYYRTLNIDNSNLTNYYCWNPDFQDLYLPQFFTKAQLDARAYAYKQLINDREKIVFSSYSALNDFNKFFPENVNDKRVVRFVSSPDADFKSLSIDTLKNKFGIKGDYFIVSNQFWKHKNHRIVLEAFKEIFEKHQSFQLVLTGKEFDNRDSDNSRHISELKEFVVNNGLTDKILFLGFIDRSEQLKLMSEALAIIQPSLFEGWSTVVEDAKFLNQSIICSDIPVHREQLPDYDLFFEPTDRISLIRLIEKVLENPSQYKINYIHQDAMMKFGHDFVSIFE
jgi:glycosyltransferase involved in cell wall biosynthesis